MTASQRNIIERLKNFAQTDLEAANRALKDDATEFDVKIALYMAHTIGID